MTRLQLPPVWLEPEALTGATTPFHSDPLVAAILSRRLDRPEDVADFLDPRARAAPDPFLVPNMGLAVDRIRHALAEREPIGIFGDYDTDGVTSSAILTLALRAASGGEQPVSVRLPLRQEGYGFSVAGVDDLAAAGAKLLITVDCGSKDHAAVEHAQALGLEVIIVDHHRMTEPPPQGAIVVSAQGEPDSPLRTVSAAGLAYLLATALAQSGLDTGNGPGAEPLSLLDLAMIGLIGDVSNLTGVNRALVRDGLRQVRTRPRPGLRALGEAGGINLASLSSSDVAFLVSPRLNAPGRLGDPQAAYELLVAQDEQAARHFAAQTEAANQQRKALQNRVLRDIDALVLRDPALLEKRALIFASETWEAGIVGLVASNIADRFARPAMVMQIADGMARGSARSVPGFDIAQALAANADLLERFGGHERAAGLSVPIANLPELEAMLQIAIAGSEALPPGPDHLEIDADLPPARLRMDTLKLLQTLGPFGEGNPLPLLRIQRAPLRDYVAMGNERQHLKLHLGEGTSAVAGILWSGGSRSRELVGARHVDVVGHLEANVWQGVTRLQVRLVDFRVSA